MKPASLKIGLVLSGALLFNIIFWQEKLAMNALLFDVFILAAVFYLYKPAFKKPVMTWLLLAHLITLATVVIHNTLLSKLAFTVTLLLVIVFTQFEHRSLWYAAASALMNYVLMIPSFFAGVKELQRGKINFYNARKFVRFIIIPVIMLIVFSLLYNFSNAVFRDVLVMAGDAISQFFSRFFDWFSWSRLGFLLVGLFVTGGLLLRSRTDIFSRKDTRRQDVLLRQKHDLVKWKQTPGYDLLSLLMGRFANGMLALRNENAVGIISLFLLNLLLLFINWLDVVYVWFGFTYDNKNINLSAYVHEGAGLLIFSIVLAMLVLLFFFRGNLNFYKKNKWLKTGAYLWIVQNTVLVVSVLFRDYYYIHEYGLAYKRIGVLVFLLLVLTGLFTMFIKISRLKTTYFLLKVNAWVVLTVMVLASCIHWDETIAGYNLARKTSLPLDIRFLLSLSDKTLPLIEQNQDVLSKTFSRIPDADGDVYYRGTVSATEYFNLRKRQFFEAQHTYSWLSWNAADSYVKAQLHEPAMAVLPNN